MTFLHSLWTILTGWLSNKPTTAPAASSSSVSVDVVPGSSYAQAVNQVAKTVDDVIITENTPDMKQGRENVLIQKAKDKINKDAQDALKSGDVTDINKDLA